jgi:hypothetical protein
MPEASKPQAPAGILQACAMKTTKIEERSTLLGIYKD